MLCKDDIIGLDWSENREFVFPDWNASACNWWELSPMNSLDIKWKAQHRRARLHSKGDTRFADGPPFDHPRQENDYIYDARKADTSFAESKAKQLYRAANP